MPHEAFPDFALEHFAIKVLAEFNNRAFVLNLAAMRYGIFAIGLFEHHEAAVNVEVAASDTIAKSAAPRKADREA